MRYRSKHEESDGGMYETRVYPPYPDGFLAYSAGPGLIWTSEETMEDMVGSVTEWHPVSHVKSKYFGGTPPNYVIPPDPEFGGGSTYVYSGTYCYTWGVDLPQPEIPPGLAGMISRKALENATRQVPMKVSIANFLLELKNPKELLPRVSEFISRKTPSDLYLWWKFGAEPFVRDLKALMTVWADTRKRLDHLKKVNHRTVTIHYKHGNITMMEPQDVEELNEAFALWSMFYDPVYPQLSLRMDKFEGSVDVQMQVTYDLQGLDGPWAFWDSLASSLGLNNPAGIVWEAIPFSFVVDWIVPVGDFIENLNPGAKTFDGDIRVVSCHHTIKTDAAASWYSPTNPDGGYQKVCSMTAKGFYRREGLPGGQLITDGLTTGQQLLGAALLNSQASFSRKRRRRR